MLEMSVVSGVFDINDVSDVGSAPLFIILA
jgi:hypothetical protein